MTQKNWDVQSAFWVAQACRSSGEVRELKWGKARATAPWLPEKPPESEEAVTLMIEALDFLAREMDDKVAKKISSESPDSGNDAPSQEPPPPPKDPAPGKKG